MPAKKKDFKLVPRAIKYIKPDEEVAGDRVIITADEPKGTILCLDVTALLPEEQHQLAAAYTQYQLELQAHLKDFRKFETWLEQKAPNCDHPEIKWRSLASNRIIDNV